MGTENRSKSYDKNVPGPGQYEHKSRLGEAPKFSISSKAGIDSSKYVVSPGPGIYTPKYNYMYKNLSYSMRIRPDSAKSTTTPGPGNYNVRTEKSLQVPTYK